ncbi:MAG: hypothetical protein WAL72_00705, partial [Streptosporangiaceae bacterium]
MIATHVLASGAGTNYTLVGVLLAIFVPIFGALAAILVGYFGLQRHRADAVAMAAYRKLAEEAVANQALLSWLGPRADWGRIPFLGRGRAAARPSRLWAALVRRVVAHPAIWGVTATAALLALAAPALGMRLGEPAVDVPPGQAVIATTATIQRAFPQTPSPAEVVVTGPGATGPRVLAAVAALQGRAAAAGPIREPVTATRVGGPGAGSALVIDVPLAGHGSDSVSD